LSTVRAGKVQVPRLISYCAPIIIGLVILVGTISNSLPVQVRAPTLIVPVPLGIVLGVLLYYRMAHEVVQYDQRGYMVIRGKRVAESHDWNEFAAVSLSADQKGGINVRLYFEPDGKYVEIPASRTGVDAFSLRNNLMKKIAKSS
jgi:hypothetical protein